MVLWQSSFLSVEGAVCDEDLHQERSSAQEKKADCLGANLESASDQIWELNLHLRNKWSLTSSSTLHRQQHLLIFNPQEASLALVGSLFKFASHMLKACLGTAPLNHTVVDHALEVLRGRRTSHVRAEEKPLQTLSFTTQAVMIVECCRNRWGNGGQHYVEVDCSVSSRWSQGFVQVTNLDFLLLFTLLQTFSFSLL